MIKLDNFSINIGDKTLLKPCDFSFGEGKTYLISGNNGSGKSTLLKIVANDINMDSYSDLSIHGDILFNNVSIFSESGRDLLSKNICYISQDDYFFLESSTIGKEIAFYYQLSNQKKASNEDIIDVLNDANLVGLLEKSFNEKIRNILNLKISKLSGGQRKIVHIIREIVKNPNVSVLVFDEPLNNLDIKNISSISNLIRSCLGTDKVCLIVSHCKIFPFVDEEYVLHNAAFDKCKYDCKNCFGDGNKDGYLVQ